MTSALCLGFVAGMTMFVVALIDHYINSRAALRSLLCESLARTFVQNGEERNGRQFCRSDHVVFPRYT
jgi:hypothetical protein